MSAPRLTGEQLRRVAYYSVRLESGAPLSPAETAELQALCTDLTLAAAAPTRAKEPAEQVRARVTKHRQSRRPSQPKPETTVTPVTGVTPVTDVSAVTPLSPSPSPSPSPVAAPPEPQHAASGAPIASPAARPAAALEGVGGGVVQAVVLHQDQEQHEEHDEEIGTAQRNEHQARATGPVSTALVVTPRARQGSEAVKAALLVALHDRGVTAEPEVKLPATSGRSRRPWFVVDVGVRAGAAGPLVAVVECKPYTGIPGGERQRENYAGCGVPAFACGPGDVPALAAFLARLVAAAADGAPLPVVGVGVTRIPPGALVSTRDDGPLANGPLAMVAAEGAERQAMHRRRAGLAEFVFSYWQQKLGHPTALFDRHRQKKLEARLAENGDNAHELCYVVDGALKDDWLMGRDDRAPRKYDGIETLFRNRAQVERLATLCGGWRRQDPHPIIVAEERAAQERADARRATLSLAAEVR